MSRLTPEEEKKKRAIFESMSPKWRERIMRKGYDLWDPFTPPRDPIDLRVDQSGNAARDLIRKFLELPCPAERSHAYVQGAWDICVGMIEGKDRSRGMYDFCCWYREFLEKKRST